MSGEFSDQWLRLREPYDARACNAHLLARLVAWRARRSQLHVVDLGSGTAANLRRTAAILRGHQTWTLVEWDPALIASGERQLAAASVNWRYRRLDLTRDLQRVGDQPCDLITASALLDLVSADWLDDLVTLQRRTSAALYMALSYNGQMVWAPVAEGDELACDLINAHQRIDKSFGTALGPDAVPALASRLDPAAGAIEIGRSDWVLGRSDEALQATLLAGYEAAAIAIAPEAEDALRRWAGRRRVMISGGQSRLRVGHSDLLLLPDVAGS